MKNDRKIEVRCKQAEEVCSLFHDFSSQLSDGYWENSGGEWGTYEDRYYPDIWNCFDFDYKNDKSFLIVLKEKPTWPDAERDCAAFHRMTNKEIFDYLKEALFDAIEEAPGVFSYRYSDEKLDELAESLVGASLAGKPIEHKYLKHLGEADADPGNGVKPWKEIFALDSEDLEKRLSDALGNKVLDKACKKIEIPDDFSMSFALDKKGKHILDIRHKSGQDKSDAYIRLTGYDFGKIVKKALEKCGESEFLKYLSGEELDELVGNASKALKKAVTKVCGDENIEMWSSLASESGFVSDAARKTIEKMISKKTVKYLCKEIEKEQEKEGDDLE